MKLRLRHLFPALALAALTTGCANEDELTYGPQTAVTFTSSVTTRAADTSWSRGDAIGVYMMPAGTPLTDDNTGAAGGNVRYVTTAGDGRFEAAGEPLRFPAEGEVDFVAYYPWSASTTGASYRVDLTDQSDPERIDLLYADNLRAQQAADGAGRLQFDHRLARLTLTLTSSDGSDLSRVKARLAGVPSGAWFDLGTGQFAPDASTDTIDMRMRGSSTQRTATALLVPTGTLDEASLVLDAGSGRQMSVALPDGIAPTAGADHTLTVDVRNVAPAPSTDPADYPQWTETPSLTPELLANAHLRYVTHYIPERPTVRNYSLLYNTDLKMALWVAYPLCNYYTRRNTDRTNRWDFDPELTQGEQADMRSGLGNGYDRGHQIPSADRLVTTGANEQTFYYTNMTPQLGSRMNQTIWSNLEAAVRGWSSNIDTLYVVTGAMPTTADDTTVSYTDDCAGQPVAVPKVYYKALAYVNRRTGEARTIAFRLPHRNYNSDERFMDFAISVSELERETGFTFFPQIDEQYKATFDPKLWP